MTRYILMRILAPLDSPRCADWERKMKRLLLLSLLFLCAGCALPVKVNGKDVPPKEKAIDLGALYAQPR